MTGRKPIPTKLHLLRGNPGKRKRNPREPQPTDAIPECPSHLDERAAEEWNRVVPRLTQMRVLADVDRASLAAYCVVWSRWVDAEDRLARFGTVIKSPSGYAIQSPFLGIANRCIKQLQELSSEFGMTPSSRTRVVALKEESADEFAEFLKGAAKR